jgi:hypothetical protein
VAAIFPFRSEQPLGAFITKIHYFSSIFGGKMA